jgi:predicted methyltransferase
MKRQCEVRECERSESASGHWTARRARLWSAAAALFIACAGSMPEPGSAPPPESAAAAAEGSPPPAESSPQETAVAPSPDGMPPPAPGGVSAPAAAAQESVPGAASPRDTAGPPTLVDFIAIGRGDRVADLGSGVGYSIPALIAAAGPAGVVYVRRDPRGQSDLRDEEHKDEQETPSNLVVMRTSYDAPLVPAAVRLNEVTFLFEYHELVATGRDRRAFNAAVFKALVPGGTYVVADYGAPEGSGVKAAKELKRIEAGLVRKEIEAAGFTFVAAADISLRGAAVVQRGPDLGEYVLKFKRP